MPPRYRDPKILVTEVPEYADLEPWAAELCELGYRSSLEQGRRRRAGRGDFVAGWKEGARQLGRLDVFKDDVRPPRSS